MRIKPEDHFLPNVQDINKLLSQYGLQLISYKPANSGIENTTLFAATDKGGVVIRIYRSGKKSLEQIYDELHFMHHLSKNGIPVPRVLHNHQQQLVSTITSQGQTWQTIVMQKIDGKHASSYSTKMIENLAITQANIHELADSFTGSSHLTHVKNLKDDTFINQINLNSVRDTRLKHFLSRAKDYSLKLDPALATGACHLDYDKDNVLFLGNNIQAVLDFDDLQIAPYIVCLGYALRDVYYSTKKISSVLAYLDAYQNIRPLSEKELDYIRPVMLARHYAISALNVLEGNLSNDNILQMILQEKTLLDTQLFIKAR